MAGPIVAGSSIAMNMPTRPTTVPIMPMAGALSDAARQKETALSCRAARSSSSFLAQAANQSTVGASARRMAARGMNGLLGFTRLGQAMHWYSSGGRRVGQGRVITVSDRGEYDV